MSSLLQAQPELLSNINFILAPLWGGYSAVVILGGCGLLLLTVLVVYKWRRHQLTSGRTLLGAMAVLWLPLLLHFLFNAVIDIRNDISMTGQPLAEQLRSRYCQVDLAQHLGGALCGVPPLVELVERDVPTGSSLAIAASAVNPYLQYQLAGEYSFGLPPEQSDYFLIYQTWDALTIGPDGSLYRNRGADSSAAATRAPVYIGKFSIEAEIDPHQLILKRRK